LSWTTFVRAPRSGAPFRGAAVRTWPLLTAFLTAVPPPVLAALAWARARAFRARLDFDAVIRASPPVISRLLCAQSWVLNATGT
jgi:hypothetical protein